MNERNATELEYKLLNKGSEDGQFSRGFTDFSERVMDLWFLGDKSDGKRGIVPAEPFPSVSEPMSLSFWLIQNGEKIKFEGWVMNRIERVTHMSMFVNLYTGEAGTGQIGEEEESDGATAELKISFAEQIVPSTSTVEQEPIKVAASVGLLALNKSKEKKRKKKKQLKADMFDPLQGLLY